jgi:hypothetical protein
LDAKCIVFGNNVGSDPFNVDTFMELADWIGIVTTCGVPVQKINIILMESQLLKTMKCIIIPVFH